MALAQWARPELNNRIRAAGDREAAVSPGQRGASRPGIASTPCFSSAGAASVRSTTPQGSRAGWCPCALLTSNPSEKQSFSYTVSQASSGVIMGCLSHTGHMELYFLFLQLKEVNPADLIYRSRWQPPGLGSLRQLRGHGRVGPVSSATILLCGLSLIEVLSLHT